MPRRLLRVFGGKRRLPAAALKAKPVLSPAEAASRNYARMHQAAMARDRRSVDGR